MKQLIIRGILCLFCIFCLLYLLRHLSGKKYETFESMYKLPLQFHVMDMSYGNTRSWITKTEIDTILDMVNTSVFEPCGIQWTSDIIHESVPLNTRISDLFLLGPSSEIFDDTTGIDPRLSLYMSLVPKASVEKQKTNVYFVNYLGPGRNGKTMTSVQVDRYSDLKMDLPTIFLGQYSQNGEVLQTERRDISSIAFSFAHELCHVLGLPHSNDVANLMYLDTAFANPFSTLQLSESQKTILIDGAKVYQQKNGETRNAKYDANAIVDYHSTEAQIREEESQSQHQIQILGDDGKMRDVPMEKAQNLPTYFSPGTYPFGTANYVPLYADSVLLSKPTLAVTELQDTPDMMAGFCQQEKNNPMKLEETCMAMDHDKCASSQCCISLGGSKCVAGNDRGPTNVSHYNDTLLKNREFYYYQGKCYGNCI